MGFLRALMCNITNFSNLLNHKELQQFHNIEYNVYKIM